MHFRTSLYASIMFLTPVLCSAEVLINEVAWMGSKDSAHDEWIELYNAGSSGVALDGWTLADNDTLSVTLSGTLPAKSYAVLERTDDDSAPGGAFLIYTGALSNSGATLRLLRDDGGLEDQVAGGENWEEIGGDNESKDTAQRTDSGWITASPTPNAQNSTVASVKSTDDDEDDGDGKNSGADADTDTNQSTATSASDDDNGNDVRLSLQPTGDQLALRIVARTVGYVHQPVHFSAEATGIGKTLRDSLAYRWNFGDIYTAETKAPTHSFAFPGEYVVMLEAEYASHEARARHEITILPMNLSLSRSDTGTIVLRNNAKYEVNLGGYTLRGEKQLSLPKNTIVQPNGVLRIAQRRLENGAKMMIGLYDSRGVLVASDIPRALARAEPSRPEPGSAESGRALSLTPKARAAPLAAQPVTDDSISVETAAERGEVSKNTMSDTKRKESGVQYVSKDVSKDEPQDVSTLGASVANSGTGLSRNERLPYLFLGIIIVLGILGIYTRRLNRSDTY